MKITHWQRTGQILLALAFIFLLFQVCAALPNPAWEIERQAETTVVMAAEVETRWEPAYEGRLAASDLEKWGIAPKGWRRSGNGWKAGPGDEHFEIGTWAAAADKKGFAFIFSHIPVERCRKLNHLVKDAFDQVVINNGHSCGPEGNTLVFYRAPS